MDYDANAGFALDLQPDKLTYLRFLPHFHLESRIAFLLPGEKAIYFAFLCGRELRSFV